MKQFTTAEVDTIYANIKKKFDYLKTVRARGVSRYFFVSAPIIEKVTKDEATGVETRELVVDKANCRTRRTKQPLNGKLRPHEVVL